MSRLIDAEKLKEDLFIKFGNQLPNGLFDEIDNARTFELDESVIQELLNPLCMTVVSNEYLAALHGKRQKGEWIVDDWSKIVECNKCRGQAPIDVTSGEQYRSNYCPICGADMRH